MRAALVVGLLTAVPALAQDIVASEIRAEAPAPQPSRTFANFRIGASTASARPVLCLDIAPLDFLSLEACGTGSGFMHRDPNPEIAHFRTGFVVRRFRLSTTDFSARLHAGFAEIQIGDDDAGFQFTSTGPRGVETAGPEAGASLEASIPLGLGLELIGNLNVSMLWVPFAPQLVLPSSTFQPSLSLSFGVGF